MNPFASVTRPLRDIGQAVSLLFQAVFVVGLTGTVNAMTYTGVWWFQWAALGMGIALVVAWARALRALLLVGLVAAVGWFVYRRWGAAARARWQAWVDARRGAAQP